MGRKTYSRRELPPCPDAEKYLLVKTTEGYYWRKKRGTVKKAGLNASLARNVATSKITGPAASKLLHKLEPYTRELKMGRMTLRIAGVLMKTYHAKGSIDFSMLEGFEFNNSYTLDKLFHGLYTVTIHEKEILIRLDLQQGTVQPQNNLVTDYYFEAVLVNGDLTDGAELKIRTQSTPLFSFLQNPGGSYELSLLVPKKEKSWMLLLKVNCLEGNELGLHPKHYAMKVVKVG